MVKELQRKCSCCGNNGHSARTCNDNGTGRVKLFGVDISENKVEQSIKRSFSLGNLEACDEEHNSNVRNVNDNVAGDESGYLSDGLIDNKKRKDAHERKKGVPWSEEEHRTFLAGLESVGKGKWSEIARRFVTTRTPIQIASHAQKYFLRKTAKDKKRSSLFDKELDAESQTSHGSTAMKSAEISSQVGDLRRVAFIPVMGHPSGIPSAKSNSHKSSVSGVSEKDGLELKVGLPQTSKTSKPNQLESYNYRGI